MHKDDVIDDLMNKHGTEILHLAYSYVRNKQTAEDLTQDIFLKCYERLDSFQGRSQVKTWLFRIAINHCKDYLRSWYYRKIQLTDLIADFGMSTDSSPEATMMKNDEKNKIHQAIFLLPIKYREIIFLYYFHELSQKEISEICKMNINTVKSRLTTARKLLKKKLA